VLWGGLVWRLRGGAFARLSGVNLGTQGTRLSCGLLLAGPLAAVDIRALLFCPALAIGLSLVGWGPYMGLGRSTPDRAVGVVDPVLRVVWRKETWLSDFTGLALCGVICLAPAMPIAVWLRPATVICLFTAGLAFAPAYALGYALRLPTLGAWVDDATVWGEVLVGLLVAAALWAVVIG